MTSACFAVPSALAVYKELEKSSPDNPLLAATKPTVSKVNKDSIKKVKQEISCHNERISGHDKVASSHCEKQSLSKRQKLLLRLRERVKKSKAGRSTTTSRSRKKQSGIEHVITGHMDRETCVEFHVSDDEATTIKRKHSASDKGSIWNVKTEDTHLPFKKQFCPQSHSDSNVAARNLFTLLIKPVPLDKFYSEVWERKPLLVQRHKPDYNAGWFSTKELDIILKQHNLHFSTNIDVTNYVNETKVNLNPDGRAYAPLVWEYYKDGCSIRVLNPQTFSKSMWLLNSTLQEHFQSFVGANVYLTPPDSQGFAPHYDDIEAFVLQLEGKKRWRLYQPRNGHELLPRFSSPNFARDTIGEPILDVVLEAGDLLYFPRGVIHQASTLPDSHSLHVTLSTYQLNSWGDFLQKLLPAALQVAISEDVDFRRGLPTGYLDYTGLVNSDSSDLRRTSFFESLSDLMSRLTSYALVDSTADQMGVDHVHNCLPPCLNHEEEQSSLLGKGARWKGSVIQDGEELTPDTEVKLIRKGAMRLVAEGEEIILYHTLQNSKVYHEREVQGMEILANDVLAVEYLLKSYPNYVKIGTLPSESGTVEDNVELCDSLYRQGLLLIKQ